MNPYIEQKSYYELVTAFFALSFQIIYEIINSVIIILMTSYCRRNSDDKIIGGRVQIL